MTMSREELRDSARKAFGEDGPMPDAGASWARLSEMGWFMMTVPEDRGGLGLGREALAVIHAELGRALVPGPAIAQMLAIEALSAAGGHDELLAEAMAGERITASLDPGANGLTLTCVPDVDRASRVLVVARDRIALAEIGSATPRSTWDETRRLFDVVPGAEIVLAEGAAAHALADQLDAQLLLALAADSLGAAEAVLALTIEYLKTRRQFDRPLALFQALKHRLADMQTWAVGADALLWSRANDQTTLTDMGALKAHVTRACLRIAEEAVQLHGGIGLTEEHPCHRFLKRIFLNAALGGDADHWDEQTGRAALAGMTDGVGERG